MNLEIISYNNLSNCNANISAQKKLVDALLQSGIVGISDIPNLDIIISTFLTAARRFTKLSEDIKKQYSPHRDAGETEGYELGAEWFKNNRGEWQIDDKKASYYAFVPDNPKNKWPKELDLKNPYLNLGQLIFNVGQLVLNSIALPIDLNKLTGYGRLLHYLKVDNHSNDNSLWCGAHFDHGLFTGLIPAFYFDNDEAIEEPDEAGLYIIPSNQSEWDKVEIDNKNIIMFQVGEFGQLISNDQIKATKHCVRKALTSIERYSFALFYSAPDAIITSKSMLIHDERYLKNQVAGKINYNDWEQASYAQYRAV